MLQVTFLRDEKERVIEGLKKRHFKNLDLVDAAISADDNRKKLQFDLDSQLAEMNKISKEIGIMMKEGRKDDAEAAKSQTAQYKESSKELQQQLNELANRVGRSTIAVVDAITQRGGFKGEELSTIGALRDQCVQIVQLVESIQQEEALNVKK